MFSFPFRFFVSFLYVFRVHTSECKKNVKHFKTKKNSLKYKKKQHIPCIQDVDDPAIQLYTQTGKLK